MNKNNDKSNNSESKSSLTPKTKITAPGTFFKDSASIPAFEMAPTPTPKPTPKK